MPWRLTGYRSLVGRNLLGFIIVNLSDMISDINVSKTAIGSMAMATFAVTVAFISGRCNLTCHGDIDLTPHANASKM